MEEINDVEALEKISSEVDESQIKVILSNQCIKAQAFLLDKLKKQSERHKETCSFISSANLKLEAEIRQAEQEIKSMLLAQETIKSAKVELKKELLVVKVRKADIKERIEEGIKKYEALWSECKARYESIPFVKQLINANEKVQVLNNDIEGLDKQTIELYEVMRKQREACIDIDRKRCIELATFIAHEVPNTKKIIHEKTVRINDVTKQIEAIINAQKNVRDIEEIIIVSEPQKTETNDIEEKEPVKNDDLNKSDEDSLIPKLELSNFDLDSLDINLERVRMRKEEIASSDHITDAILDSFANKKTEQTRSQEKAYDYVISPFFNTYKENDSQNFSNRKLINILEDVRVTKKETYNIIKEVNKENLRTVNEISVNAFDNVKDKYNFSKDKGMPIESDTIEEVDMSCSSTEIIIPPTQFLDITITSSQEDIHKKRVSFDIPSSVKINEIIDDEDTSKITNDNEEVNQTANSQLDVSVVSEDGFMKIQDMILKKHNLDLSPQFVYAKNPVLQKKEDDKVVTSKFFQHENQEDMIDEMKDDRMEMDEEPRVPETEEKLKEQESKEKTTAPMDVDVIIVSSPKENKKHEDPRPEKPLTGLLFNHGTQAIPDSLNVSMSTTGYDDSDFPHCIDSSLLLSPKADIPMTDDNPEVQSQEVPNFLSGLRKTGLSFFGGGNASAEPKPGPSTESEGNNFSFNFGGEKKSRGGLFSLFQ
ncbi:uncharacterized protein LOC110372847 [Helicoverpa armigera]|uniref:uncharacterized protein LOC110372847 n=1 Tax=Helicoverpa armigera TaxID=29058 RepID=UPI0030834E3F